MHYREYFSWDVKNAANHFAKHSVRFEAATLIFEKRTVEVSQVRNGETRFLALGQVEEITLAVVYSIVDGRHHLISARYASRKERRIHASQS